jgi:hypothetical protein
MEVEPGPGSCISTPHNQRSMVANQKLNLDGELTQIVIAGDTFNVEDGEAVPTNQNQEEITITSSDSVKLEGYIWVGGRRRDFTAKIPLEFEKE